MNLVMYHRRNIILSGSTIEPNIKFGAEASMDIVKEAAEIAQATEFSLKLSRLKM